MKIELVSTEGLVKTCKAVVSANDIQTQKASYIKKRAPKVKVDGFRPGKAPAHILEQRLGGDALNHVLRNAIEKAIKSAKDEHKIRAYGEPKVDFDKFEDGQDLSFTITFESMPVIEQKDLSHIELEKIAVTVADEEVDRALAKLHKEYEAFKAEEGRVAEKGDHLVCEISIQHEGKSISLYQKLPVTIQIGENDFMMPEMDDAVLGKKASDTVTFTAKNVSEKFGDKKIVGKDVDVSVLIKEVQSRQSFELNDDFAKEFKKETLDELKQTIKEGLEREYNSAGRLYVKRHLLDALENEFNFDLPPSMVQQEFDSIWAHLQAEIKDAKEKGEEIDDEGKSEDEVRTEYEGIAKRRVKLGLLVSHVAHEEKIQLTEEELRIAIFREAMRYPGQEREVIEFYRKNPKMIDRLAAPILEDKVVDFLLTKVVLKEIALDVKSLKDKVKGVIPTSFFDDEQNDDKQESAA